MSYRWEPPDILGPIMRGLQIRNYVEDLKARREARAQQAELHRAALEEHQQNTAIRKFQLMRTLADSGFIPAAPGDTGQNDEAISQAIGGITPENRRPLMQTPFGNYRAPSQTDQFKLGIQRARQAGTLKGVEDKATEEVMNPYEEVPLPEQLGGGTARVKKGDVLQKKIDLFKTLHPNLNIRQSTPNDSGDVIISGWDPTDRSGKPVFEYTQKGAGKTKTVPQGAQSIPNFDAQVKALMDAWRPGHYNQLGITPEVIEAAKGPGEQSLLGGSSNPAATRIRQAEDDLYKRAVDSLKNSAKAAPTASAAASPGVVLPRANVPAAAQRKGMSVPDFLKWFQSNGGIVQ